ncbi:hypothetical protein LEB14_10040 [Salmonella enterica]|uniref:hypothetical protein n=1 Tax=Salmonella enterica TaxID=28901 RepID=UPI001EDE55B3|nr:hypothetical protein [Salmonella enterica]MCG3547904.1 hypothetical protein [Salmonella enterica subsp. diarizonae]MDJ3481141.1 hypothetical protein [Salmonella enterica]
MDNTGTGDGDTVDTTDVGAVILPLRSFPLNGLRPIAVVAVEGVDVASGDVAADATAAAGDLLFAVAGVSDGETTACTPVVAIWFTVAVEDEGETGGVFTVPLPPEPEAVSTDTAGRGCVSLCRV